MKTEILKYLREADGYVSGQELCERLGVSRTAIWKVIESLREEGHEIEAVRNRGYRLMGTGDVFSEAALKSELDGTVFGKQLVFLSQVDSTNTRAKQLAEAGAPDGTLVVAECQTAGKGRRGRGWDAPAGSGIWMSLLLRPEVAPDCASMLTLVAAMAVETGIRSETGLCCQIKWPNDIVYHGKKLCGILTEMSADMDSINHVVVGIGVNVNGAQFPPELKEKATSLLLETGQAWNRASLAAEILRAFDGLYRQYLAHKNLSWMKTAYNERLAGIGGPVRVLSPAGDYTAISRGITDTGELLAEREDHTIETVLSGEVSVRGIYGYV